MPCRENPGTTLAWQDSPPPHITGADTAPGAGSVCVCLVRIVGKSATEFDAMPSPNPNPNPNLGKSAADFDAMPVSQAAI